MSNRGLIIKSSIQICNNDTMMNFWIFINLQKIITRGLKNGNFSKKEHFSRELIWTDFKMIIISNFLTLIDQKIIFCEDFEDWFIFR